MAEPTKARQEKIKSMQRIKAAYDKAKQEGSIKTTTLFFDEDKMEDKDLRMVFFVRTDLKMPKGKIAAQVGHAVQYLILSQIPMSSSNFIEWSNGISTKICLKVSSEDELLAWYNLGKEQHFPVTKVEDIGLTCFNGEKTLTVVGWGPVNKRDHSHLTEGLKLL